MPFAKIGSAWAGGQNGATTSGFDTTGSDLLVAVIVQYSQSGSKPDVAISDSKGNSWVELTAQEQANPQVKIAYVAGADVGSGHTVTIDGANSYSSVTFIAFSGVDTESPFDDESGDGATAGVLQPGSITPANDNSLIIGGSSVSTGRTYSVDGFIIEHQQTFSSGSYMGSCAAYQIQTTATASNPEFDVTTSTSIVVAQAVFKAASGGGGGGEPTLSNASAVASGTTAADLAVSTNQSDGDLYCVVTSSGSTPSAAQVKSGQDHTGSAALFDDSQEISSSGEKTFAVTGLSANNAYYAYFMHENDSAEQSLVYSTGQFYTRVEIPVTDEDVFFSPYNWYSDGGGAMQSNNVKASSTYAVTNNPGAYLKTEFTGTAAWLNVNVSVLTGASVSALAYPAIAYSVDGAAWTREQLSSSSNLVELATELDDETHTLEVVFLAVAWNSRDRWETPVMQLRVDGIQLNGTEDVSPPTTFSSNMIIYGDSHSEGHEALAATVNVANQDASQSYAAILARAFECEYGTIGFAGQGYTSTGGATNNVPDLEDAWDFYSDGKSRLVSGEFSPIPDYIISAHGHNDSSALAVQTAVANLIAAWRSAAPETPILLMLAPGLSHETGVRNGHADSADGNSYVIDLAENFLINGSSYKNGSHLSLRGHTFYAAANAKAIQAALVVGGGGRPNLLRALQQISGVPING